MGYKFFDTIIQFNSEKPLKSDESHTENKAIDFLSFINKGAKLVTSEELAEHHYYFNDKTDVGAYDEGFIISNFNLCSSFIYKDKVAKKILKEYPNSEITSVFVLETSNSVGFTKYVNGEQVRAFCCDSENITLNNGNTQLDTDITVADGEPIEEWNIGLISALNYYDNCFTKQVAQNEAYDGWNKSEFLWPYPGFLKRLFM